jgi:TRAP-type C4-dicarboxylate transport system substrate-binding protein
MPFDISRTILPILLSAVVCLGQNIKLASLAPSGSPYDNGLRSIAADWEKISNNSIKMTIYSGGVAGDEDDMMRKMKIGQLQAAGITAVGLSRVVKDIITIQLPMLVRTNDELFYVMEKMDPAFGKELEEKGLKVLVWMPVGWVRYFARQPVSSPEQLRKMKMFCWAGDPNSVQAWNEMGFHPIPLAATDLMSSLQSGMVDAFATPALTAASYQWFTIASNMCELKWAPLIGGIVISTTAWNRVPPDLRPRLEDAIRKHGAAMSKEILGADEKAVEAMKQNGLAVNPVSPEQLREWEKVAELGLSKIEGKSFQAEYRQLVQRYVDEFRNSRK